MNWNLTDFLALILKLLLFIHLFITKSYDEVKKSNIERMCHYGDQSLLPSTSNQYSV